jgi:Fe-S-cluster-containing hydrogenase component 2
MCISVCPIGGIGINPIRGQVIKCDLCGGQPTCVEFCSVGALQYLAADEVDTTQKRKSLKKNIALIEKENYNKYSD